jgi:hypothetical protein
MRSKGLSPKQKRRNSTPLFILIVLFPYIVGFTPDSTSSSIETIFGIGTGQFVYHDCSGAHSQKFADAGIYIGEKYEGPYRAGLIAGGFGAGDQGSSFYLFPDLALDWTTFSIGTTGIRLGALNDVYFEGRWADQPPLLSGKGALRFGFGRKLKPSGNRFWLGVNTLPYNNFGLAAQLELPYDKNSFIFFNGRYGNESGMGEYGISAGIRLVTF